MDEGDIAAAMGFSSFGSAKKRKYDETSSPKAKQDASGANSTKLGVRTKTKPEVANQDDTSHEGPEVDETKGGVVPSTEPPQTNRKGKQKQSTADGLAAFLSRGQGLPDKSASAPTTSHPSQNSTLFDDSEMTSFGGPAISRAELNALRHGVTTDDGDVAYFQPSFVEDPWEKLRRPQVV